MASKTLPKATSCEGGVVRGGRCNYKRCPRPALEGDLFCAELSHRRYNKDTNPLGVRVYCAMDGCDKYPSDDPERFEDGYCVLHGCAVANCPNPRSAGSNKCLTHAIPIKPHRPAPTLFQAIPSPAIQPCLVEGCMSGRKEVRGRVSSGLCVNHECVTRGCGRQRERPSRMCFEHKQRKRVDANKPIKTGMYQASMPDWAGWVEDKLGQWILYFGHDGRALFYPKRDNTGGVIGEGVPSGFVYGKKKPKTQAKQSKKA